MSAKVKAARSIGSKVAVVGGIGAGILAMYLLDPRYGKDRRQRITSAAHDLADQGRELSHRVSEHAAHVAELARQHYDAAREAGMSAAQSGQEALQTGRDALQSGLDSAGNARKYVDRTIANARAFAADPAAPRRGPAIAISGVVLSGALALGCGLGAMFLLDPSMGAKRRRAAVDMVTDGIHKTGQTMRSTGRQLRRSIEGVAPRVAQYLPEEEALTDSESPNGEHVPA